jgi:hypothetical protein
VWSLLGGWPSPGAGADPLIQAIRPVIRLGHTAIPEPPQIQGGAAKQLPRPLIQGGGSPRHRHEDQLPNSGDRGPSARRGHDAPAESGWPGPAPDPDTSPPGPQPPT